MLWRLQLAPKMELKIALGLLLHFFISVNAENECKKYLVLYSSQEYFAPRVMSNLNSSHQLGSKSHEFPVSIEGTANCQSEPCELCMNVIELPTMFDTSDVKKTFGYVTGKCFDKVILVLDMENWDDMIESEEFKYMHSFLDLFLKTSASNEKFEEVVTMLIPQSSSDSRDNSVILNYTERIFKSTFPWKFPERLTITYEDFGKLILDDRILEELQRDVDFDCERDILTASNETTQFTPWIGRPQFMDDDSITIECATLKRAKDSKLLLDADTEYEAKLNIEPMEVSVLNDILFAKYEFHKDMEGIEDDQSLDKFSCGSLDVDVQRDAPIWSNWEPCNEYEQKIERKRTLPNGKEESQSKFCRCSDLPTTNETRVVVLGSTEADRNWMIHKILRRKVEEVFSESPRIEEFTGFSEELGECVSVVDVPYGPDMPFDLANYITHKSINKFIIVLNDDQDFMGALQRLNFILEENLWVNSQVYKVNNNDQMKDVIITTGGKNVSLTFISLEEDCEEMFDCNAFEQLKLNLQSLTLEKPIEACDEWCQKSEEISEGQPWLTKVEKLLEAGTTIDLTWLIINKETDFVIIINDTRLENETGTLLGLNYNVSSTTEENKGDMTIISLLLQHTESENTQWLIQVENGNGKSREVILKLLKQPLLTWSKWTPCSVTCTDMNSQTKGFKTRNRECSEGINSQMKCSDYNVSIETRPCSGLLDDVVTFCPIDFTWSEWTEWSECSETCGSNSTRSKTKVCINGRYGGLQCNEAEKSEVEKCQVPDCPQDCQLGEWADWEECNSTCFALDSIPMRSRKRVIIERALNGGHTCDEMNEEDHEVCNSLPSCASSFQWLEWSDWSPCNATCGKGMRKRNRLCMGLFQELGDFCTEGQSEEVEECLLLECPQDCILGEWLSWEPCSSTCISRENIPIRNRRREVISEANFNGEPCKSLFEEEICAELPNCPINGEWLEWSQWSSCSVNCGQGTQKRFRSCKGPFFEGSACIGESIETIDCKEKECPQHCILGEWMAWSDCSHSCKSLKRVSLKSRKKEILQDGVYGGKNCNEFETVQDEVCRDIPYCPIDGYFTMWSDWSDCNAECGEAERIRTRHCVQPLHGGVNCEGGLLETESCDQGDCPLGIFFWIMVALAILCLFLTLVSVYLCLRKPSKVVPSELTEALISQNTHNDLTKKEPTMNHVQESSPNGDISNEPIQPNGSLHNQTSPMPINEYSPMMQQLNNYHEIRLSGPTGYPVVVPIQESRHSQSGISTPFTPGRSTPGRLTPRPPTPGRSRPTTPRTPPPPTSVTVRTRDICDI